MKAYLPEKPYQHRWCYVCGRGTNVMLEYHLIKAEFGKEPVIYLCNKNIECRRVAVAEGYNAVRHLDIDVVTDALMHRSEAVR